MRETSAPRRNDNSTGTSFQSGRRAFRVFSTDGVTVVLTPALQRQKPPSESSRSPVAPRSPVPRNPARRVPGQRSTDPDGDGPCEDLDGNGETDFDDVISLFEEV